MTSGGHPGRAVSDPAGLVTDLVAAAEPRLEPEQVRVVVTAVAGGRAKSRRLAAALAERPAVLADGRSPAPRAVGDLLVALRAAGAVAVSPPCCAQCGTTLRSFQRAARTGTARPAGSETPNRALRAGRHVRCPPGTAPGSRDAPSARTRTAVTRSP